MTKTLSKTTIKNDLDNRSHYNMTELVRKKRIILAGTQDVLNQSILEIKRFPEIELTAIYTSKTHAASLRSFLKKRQLKFQVRVKDIKEDYLYVKKQAADILLSIQYHRRVDQKLIKLFHGQCFNLHFSLLPKYAGCYPITWAILNGERETGVTLHFMTERFDDGDIIAQRKTAISFLMTGECLYAQQTKNALILLRKMLPNLLKGVIRRRKQNKKQFSYYDKKSIDWKKSCYVCWENTLLDVHNHIRAFTFPRFQLPKTFLENSEVTISDSRIRLLSGFKNKKKIYSQLERKENQQFVGLINDKYAILRNKKLLTIGSINGMSPRKFLKTHNMKLSNMRFSTHPFVPEIKHDS